VRRQSGRNLTDCLNRGEAVVISLNLGRLGLLPLLPRNLPSWSRPTPRWATLTLSLWGHRRGRSIFCVLYAN